MNGRQDNTMHEDRRGSAGFTLIELLVVIGIMLVLIAILIPSMKYAKDAAKRSVTANTFAAIDAGLQGYYADFNNYPSSTPGAFGSGTFLPRGSNMLAEGLAGYLDFGDDGAGPTNSDPTYGFRTRKGGMGKVYGPYMQITPKLWRVNNPNANGSLVPPPTDQVLIDGYGNEVLYYRSTRLTTATQVFGTAANALFVVTDNSTALNSNGSVPAGTGVTDPSVATLPQKFWTQIGTTSNQLNTGVVAGRNSYLLVSAGPDGVYFNDDDLVPSR
jgi:prepilin-type N-terminal cleavage/methylation domain-containing protein